MDDFNKNLRTLRIDNGYTIDELAMEIGIKAEEIERWEKGLSNPSNDTLICLANLYHLNVFDIIDGKPKETTERDEYSELIKEQRRKNNEKKEESTYNDSSYNSSYNPINSILLENEQIIWSGRPDQNKTFNRGDFILIPFSLFFLGFALFWTISAFNFFTIMGVFGLIFVGVGIYLVFGRFIYLKIQKGNTYYALTDKRIIMYNAKNGNSNAIFYEKVQNVNMVYSNNGCGTITFFQFGYNGPYHYKGYRCNYNRDAFNNSIMNGFCDIPNVHEVYKLINERVKIEQQ